MEQDKRRLGLSLLPAPDHIDACKNPYELLNDLVNVASLGDLTSSTTPASPPAFLLQVPEKYPSPYWFSECWTFNFTGQKNTVDLNITFPLPVMLSEAQILFSGDKAEWPSNVILEVSHSDDDNGKTVTPPERILISPLQGGPPHGVWISLQLKQPQMVWRAVLRIHKPKNSSGSINLYRIRLLEQSDVEMNGGDFNFDNFIKRIIECKVQVPEMLKYCQYVSSDPGSPKTLIERVTTVLNHFKVQESIKVKEESRIPVMEEQGLMVMEVKEEEKPVVEEQGLMDMPVIKEILGGEASHPQMDAILDATLSHDGGLKLIFEQFPPQTTVSQDTIAAFRRFFHLPKYREILLGDMFCDRTDWIIRLALGMTKGVEGVNMKELDSLPYEVLNWLLELFPSSTEQGRNVRRRMVQDKGIHLVLENFDRLTQDNPDTLKSTQTQNQTQTANNLDKTNTRGKGRGRGNKSNVWAKGTGFGSGSYSTTSNVWASGSGFGIGSYNYTNMTSVWAKGTGYGDDWDDYDYSPKYGSTNAKAAVNEKLLKKQSEEERVICLLNILSNFVKDLQEAGYDQGEFLTEVNELLKKSSLVTVLSSYLRNESVLDIAEHVPLYRVIFLLLSSIASIPEFWSLFIPSEGESVILVLLNKLKNAVTTYFQLLEATKNQDPEFIQLLQDIQTIAAQVEGAVAEFLKWQEAKKGTQRMETGQVPQAGASNSATSKSLEDRYVEEMKKVQFEFIKMIGDGQHFIVPYYYAAQAKKNGTESGPMVHSRFKRLAQESATLSTSLPLSYGSSIFLRCDNDRLDVIKVLITGPAGTPYSNGCFEFDIHFPLNYPNSPPMVNFETTGGRKIRFNPNLYESGKVCLSILNTWHGSPEERWNPKSSVLLPVLVAIQSLILVDQPYYNEPGHQHFGGTAGSSLARQYNANIRFYTMKYAMLDQIKNHKSCFPEVINRHFWIKRDEIFAQIDQWEKDSKDMNAISPKVFKETASALKSALLEMNPPDGLNDLTFANQKGTAAKKK